jgi:membrane protein YdbS with pleckstrin-like domain
MLTSLINIYTAKGGDWSVMALLAVIVSGVLVVSSTGLILVYKFWKLRIVQLEHEMETRAGICKVYPERSER